MKDTNMDLLEQVIEKKLTNIAEDNFHELEEKKTEFNQAMEAIDKLNQMKRFESDEKQKVFNRKLEKAKFEQTSEKARTDYVLEEKKLNTNCALEEKKLEANAEQNKKNYFIDIAEKIGVPIACAIGGFFAQQYYMKNVCQFEKDYTFTTTPGKNIIRNLFSWKK